MTSVTIEGSITPSGFLARGARATVQRTPFVEALISQGFVDVIEDDEKAASAPPLLTVVPDQRTDEERYVDDEAQKARDELGVPARNASRETWATFLRGLKPPVTVHDDDTRDELIGLWDSYDPEA